MAGNAGGFRLMDLPVEVRLRILEFSELIVRPLSNLNEDSLTIVDGGCAIFSNVKMCCGRCRDSCQCPSQSCACYRRSPALFYTCRQLSKEAREVCLSVNRMRFMGNPGTNLEMFFKRQPAHLLRLIREVEYVFVEDELDDFLGSNQGGIAGSRTEWIEFADFIAHHLNLPNLTVSLDASPPYLSWVTTNTTLEDVESYQLPQIYDCVTEPLVKLAGLKNLMIYWPVFHGLETKAEHMVMGNEYDAYQHGKVVPNDRASGFPRAKDFGNIQLGYMGTYG